MNISSIFSPLDTRESFLTSSVKPSEEDFSFLQNTGITCAQIADALESVILKASFLLEQPHASQAVIGGKIAIPLYASSHQGTPCPFSEDLTNPSTFCGVSKSFITITNIFSHSSFMCSEMTPHLIRDHHCFKDLTAKQIVDTLEIQPNVSYQAQVTITKIWELASHPQKISEEVYQAATKYTSEFFTSENREFEGFILPYTNLEAFLYNGMTPREKIEKKGLKDNKSREEIDKKIEDLLDFQDLLREPDGRPVESLLDTPVFQENTSLYLHVFTLKSPSPENKAYTISNAIFSHQGPFEIPSFSVYRLVEKKIPTLAENDYFTS